MSQTEIYKKLLTEKCPPQTPSEHVWQSILIQLAERLERLERQQAEQIKSIRFLAMVLRDKLGIKSEEAGDANPVGDQTPFPAGVSAAVPPTKAGPADELAPNAGGNGAVNTQPIPQVRP